MEPNELDGSEVLETTEEVAVETTEEAPETVQLSKAEVEELRQKAAERDELKEKNKHLFERAKKKDAEVNTEGLSNKDIIFLAKADIHDEDMDTVLDWAKFKKISVQEAHKQLKPTLDLNAETRRTAMATQTRAPARGASKATGTDLLSRAERTGEVPETNEGMRELFQARFLKRIGK